MMNRFTELVAELWRHRRFPLFAWESLTFLLLRCAGIVIAVIVVAALVGLAVHRSRKSDHSPSEKHVAEVQSATTAAPAKPAVKPPPPALPRPE